MIYFDQSATSFPKPHQVVDAVAAAMTDIGGNAGRGSHETAEVTNTLISATRQKVAQLFGCSKADHVLFFSNATVALNQAIKGLNLQYGDHVIATHYEHNSVRRPLNYLKQKTGIQVSFIEWAEENIPKSTQLQQFFKPETKLLIITHGSNVTGDVFPIKEIASIAKRAGVYVLVDASQTAGHMPIDMKNNSIDMLALPGHKGLLGPQGTGVLLVESDVELTPLHHGGTGRYSETAEQPDVWPEKYESGTLNVPGIAGLKAALEVYEQRQTENVPRETFLARRLLEGLKLIPNVTLYSPEQLQLPIVAFNIEDVNSQEVAMILDSHYQIAVRAGLHCSPLAHITINTIDSGVVRASLGIYNTEQEVDTFIQAVGDIATAYAEL